LKTFTTTDVAGRTAAAKVVQLHHQSAKRDRIAQRFGVELAAHFDIRQPFRSVPLHFGIL